MIITKDLFNFKEYNKDFMESFHKYYDENSPNFKITLKKLIKKFPKFKFWIESNYPYYKVPNYKGKFKIKQTVLIEDYGQEGYIRNKSFVGFWNKAIIYEIRKDCNTQKYFMVLKINNKEIIRHEDQIFINLKSLKRYWKKEFKRIINLYKGGNNNGYL